MFKEVILILTLLLSACGGGGSGANNEEPPSKPITFSTSSNLLNVTMTQGNLLTVSVVASSSTTQLGQVTHSDSGNIFSAEVRTTNMGNSHYLLFFNIKQNVLPGEYSGSLKIKICTEMDCSPNGGISELELPYSLTLLRNNAGLTTLQRWPEVSDWSNFQGNASHNGFVPVVLDPRIFALRWRWKAPVTTQRRWNSTLLSTGNDQVYIAAYDTLYALKEYDGGVAWSHTFSDLQMPQLYSPVTENGKIYIVGENIYVPIQGQKQLYAFNFSDGSLVFNVKTSASEIADDFLPPTVFNGSIYMNSGSAYSQLSRFDGSTGEKKFTVGRYGDTFGWSPSVAGKNAYAYFNGVLRIYNSSTGVEISRITDPSYQQDFYTLNSVPVLGDAGSVFVVNNANINEGPTNSNSIVNFNIAQNEVAWSASGYYRGYPAYNDGIIYLANLANAQLEARSESTGSLLWTWEHDGHTEPEYVGTLLLTKNLIFICDNFYTYAIDIKTHKQVWSYPATGHLSLSANGVLYILNNRIGEIVAINVSSAPN